MRVHFIAIGGAAMHNLAIALKINGYVVSGSDDVIFEPSKSRLEAQHLLPQTMGWDANRITTELDAVILGMHARVDNPELLKAQELGIPIYSYPEYIYQQSKSKKRIVVGGSHGKTSITSMILHVLNYHRKDFDYLVGAKIDGFDNMVRLSDAPVIVIEGDEYLASPIDRRPKFHLYKAHVGIISGIAWDHINVFPTFEEYKKQFELFIDTIESKGSLIFCEEDSVLNEIVKNHVFENEISLYPYKALSSEVYDGRTFVNYNTKKIPLSVFGHHNLMNLNAAKLACKEAGISEEEFYEAIASFKGAANRLEKVAERDGVVIFKDFAHSPSKLKATINAVKQQYGDKKLIACMELHTFSSLNKDFLAEYAHSMDGADEAIVFVDEKVLIQKKMPPISENDITQSFLREIIFFNNSEKLERFLLNVNAANCNVLFMSSGNFGGIDLVTLSKKILKNEINC